ncbi:hypothetical protein OG21DRAFT_1515086 [Imleria badia]|nr:hypothetical protein OG21DRAFT_1515086 [Imleria badia]
MVDPKLVYTFAGTSSTFTACEWKVQIPWIVVNGTSEDGEDDLQGKQSEECVEDSRQPPNPYRKSSVLSDREKLSKNGAAKNNHRRAVRNAFLVYLWLLQEQERLSSYLVGLPTGDKVSRIHLDITPLLARLPGPRVHPFPIHATP